MKADSDVPFPCTDGTLLDGRLRYSQPRDGYRTGIEPVLLAACIPVRPGQTVLEAGTGAGAGLLCVLTRVSGVRGIGIEADAGMAALARRNAAANDAPAIIYTADVSMAPELGPVDHAFANPPWHDPAGTRPTGTLRDAAKHRAAGGVAAWIDALAGAITPRGTVTLALPAALAAEAMALLFAARLGRMTLMPLWPRAGRPAKIVLLQGRRGTGPSVVAAGLVLHGAGQAYTEATNAVLRGGAALSL